MENVLTILGFLHLFLGTVIFGYLLSCLIFNRKLTIFTGVQLCLLVILQGTTCLRNWTFTGIDYVIKTMILDGLNLALFMNISLVLAFQYFYSSNVIYQFSIKGVLPRERSMFRFKILLILIGSITFLGGISFDFATFELVRNEKYEKS